jgi:hypothetical protein
MKLPKTCFEVSHHFHGHDSLPHNGKGALLQLRVHLEDTIPSQHDIVHFCHTTNLTTNNATFPC